jgi:hypothetical protein
MYYQIAERNDFANSSFSGSPRTIRPSSAVASFHPNSAS